MRQALNCKEKIPVLDSIIKNMNHFQSFSETLP